MTTLRSSFRGLAPFVVALLAACSRDKRGNDNVTGGTLIIAASADADAIVPPLVRGTVGKAVADVLFEPLAQIGDDMNTFGDAGFTKRLSGGWQWGRDSLSITFHLDPRARWHDGKPVRASDVRFSFGLYSNPRLQSFATSGVANIDSVSVRDSLTFVAWFKRRSAEQFYQFVYHVYPVPEHIYGEIPPDSLAASSAARQPIGSGKFRFVQWEPSVRLEVVADTGHWSGRPSLDRLVWTVTPDPIAAGIKVLAGEADFHETLLGSNVTAAATSAIVKPVRRPSMDYTLMFFNLRDPKGGPHPIFADGRMRRAISMGIDRAALAKNLFDSLAMPMAGPFVSAQEGMADGLRMLTYEPKGAADSLEALGWRLRSSDSIRYKDGRALEFRLMAPASSSARRRATVLIQEQLKRIGVSVKLEHPTQAVMSGLANSGEFDAVIMGYTAMPTINSFQRFWRKRPAGQGRNPNFGGYENPAVDALFDSVEIAKDATTQRAILLRAAQIVLDDAPGLYLYELKGLSVMHRRVQPAAMRGDAWWAHINRWSIDPAQKIDRDRLGIAPVRK